MTIEGGAWGAFVRTALGVVTYSTINRLPWTKRYGKHTQRDPSKTGDRGEDMCLAPLPSPHTPHSAFVFFFFSLSLLHSVWGLMHRHCVGVMRKLPQFLYSLGKQSLRVVLNT